jgi:hypothetical protein
MADTQEATDEEITERLRTYAATLRRRAAAERPEDPRRRDAIAGLIACVEAPRREAKHEIRRIVAESLRFSAGQAPRARVQFLKRSFEAYADELRHAGDERTAQIADRASGHCAQWMRAIDEAEAETDGKISGALIFPGQLELEAADG